MAKCNRCKQEKETYKANMCMDCFNHSKREIDKAKEQFKELADNFNASSLPQAEAIAENLKRDNIPLSRAAEEQYNKIRAKAGVLPVKQARNTQKLWMITSIVAIVALIAATILYVSAQGTVDYLYTVIREDASIISQLNAEIEELRLGDAAGKKSYVFENGNFVAGEDFAGGTYDIEALSGTGLVQSDNLLDGGINAPMGNETGMNKDYQFYEKKYSNIYLPSGTTLKIDGVKVKLTKSK